MTLLSFSQTLRTGNPQNCVAIIRCDGGTSVGYGRLKRMLSLAASLRTEQGIESVFAFQGSADAMASIRNAGFEAVGMQAGNEFARLSALKHRLRPLLLILDCETGLSFAETCLLKRDLLVAAIEDMSPRRRAADIAYYPPFPCVRNLAWDASGTVVRVGWEWAMLGLTAKPVERRTTARRGSLLVALGSACSAATILRVATSLASIGSALRARFVLGPGLRERDRLAQSIVEIAPAFETIEGADDLATEYASSDIALSGVGTGALELAAFGVPTLYLAADREHALRAKALEAQGLGLSLGAVDDVEDQQIAEVVKQLLADAAGRRRMRAAGISTIDTNGARRVAADLARALPRSSVQLRAVHQ